MDGGNANAIGTDPIALGLAMARSFDVGIFMGNGFIWHNRPSLLHKAFSLVEITALQPLEFIKLPFAVILAWLIFAESPGLWTFVGGGVIFLHQQPISPAARRRLGNHFSLLPAHLNQSFNRIIMALMDWSQFPNIMAHHNQKL